MKVKNKTELRRRIVESIGNTGSLDMIWIDKESGDWHIQNQNTSPQNPSDWLCYSMIKYYEFVDDRYILSSAAITKAISDFFKDIEKSL